MNMKYNKWHFFNGRLEITSGITKITDFKEIEIIDTLERSCCVCKGFGDDCDAGYAWIYCEIRAYFEDKFNCDCGEMKGCSAFKKK